MLGFGVVILGDELDIGRLGVKVIGVWGIV